MFVLTSPVGSVPFVNYIPDLRGAGSAVGCQMHATRYIIAPYQVIDFQKDIVIPPTQNFPSAAESSRWNVRAGQGVAICAYCYFTCGGYYQWGACVHLTPR